MDDDGKEVDLATRINYTEVTCQRALGGAQFSQGVDAPGPLSA